MASGSAGSGSRDGRHTAHGDTGLAHSGEVDLASYSIIVISAAELTRRERRSGGDTLTQSVSNELHPATAKVDSTAKQGRAKVDFTTAARFTPKP